MKKVFTSIAISLSLTTAVYAQNVEMESGLLKAYNTLDSAQTMGGMMESSNQFDLIANANQGEWLPQYYAAYTKCILSYMEPDVARKDLYVDAADGFVDQMVALEVENDHMYVLKALVANARMAVDGANRWQKYGPIFEDNLKKAKELNENNPQIYYLKAVSLYFTPKFAGGGEKKALPYFEKAKEKYALMTEHVITTPYWGEKQNTEFMTKIAEGK